MKDGHIILKSEAGDFVMQIDDSIRRMAKAVGVIIDYGGYDGGHHKMWVLDQALKALVGDDYERLIEWYEGEDYKWDIGIAP